ncbi:MAG: hypothetical protein WBD16_11150 [Pyrinomonadaceae bacterium]
MIDEKNQTRGVFTFTKQFKKRALELLDESQAVPLTEAFRIGGALNGVYAREYERMKAKYGDDHERTLEMAAKIELGERTKKKIVNRHRDVTTPFAEAGDGWAVDGFVRTSDGDAISGVTVASYDSRGRVYDEFGYGCTDKKGYFKIIVKEIPDKQLRVSLHASRGEKLLKSNENRLTPVSGGSARIDIIISEGGKDECAEPPRTKSKPPVYKSDQGKKDAGDAEKKTTVSTETAKPTAAAAKAEDTPKPSVAAATDVKPAASSKLTKPATAATKPSVKKSAPKAKKVSKPAKAAKPSAKKAAQKKSRK